MDDRLLFTGSFPGYPLTGWDGVRSRFAWLQTLHDVPQDARFHAEGDVLIHTRMVFEAMMQLVELLHCTEAERGVLLTAALLHDIAKPLCTKIEANGRITSKGHARRGGLLARRLLMSGDGLDECLPLTMREYIVRLVRYHGLPLHFFDREEKELLAASQCVRLDHLALLAEADVRGRICDDQAELLDRVALFREFCSELGCYEAPYRFSSDFSRFEYFHSERRDPAYDAYDATTCEVVMLAGLPGAGKDTYLQQHYQDWPVISLDALRQELHVSPEDDQGRVVQQAKERARELLREQRSFVWNATNVTRMLRAQLIDLFVAYGARVRLIYIETPLEKLLQRNRERQAGVPESVIFKLLSKLEVPDPIEAHHVEWVTS
ncbi:putative kinase [Thermosporothrix hazakensis]|uniref:HD domain-containing protein n=2 Tax=Thermosporothrix TaxID=768650 RepID=A0A455SKT0_9CHLR|nr:AAA family ATPase [Thermosporothrix hazakensis]PZW23556.1 putative kinase [Thermosporothrix hazakensis]BBH86775.1 hypothetical protein KTC_15260 [Thermosporothrix sp. COM3]GCE51078.1 hypothetical protein KTH_59470 [Thermosporothrix hazakensis]